MQNSQRYYANNSNQSGVWHHNQNTPFVDYSTQESLGKKNDIEKLKQEALQRRYGNVQNQDVPYWEHH